MKRKLILFLSFVILACALCFTMTACDFNNELHLAHSFTEYEYNGDATCLKNGTETATCDHAGCTEKHTRVKENSALGHSFTEPTYFWDGDKCVAIRVCTRDNTHTQTVIATVVYVKDTDATCLVAEKGHYEATFEDSAFTTQSTASNSVINGEPLGHSFTEYEYNDDATCLENGTETVTCDHAGCTETHTRVKENSALGHSFTEYIYNNDATCLENGSETATCDHVGCAETDTRVKENSALGHDYSTEWSIDETYHWHECECGAKIDISEHTFDENDVCTTCGRQKYSQGLSYSFSGNAYTVTGIGTCKDTDIIIPFTYNDGTNGEHPVTSIGYKAFYYCYRLTSVVIPDSVASIGDSAFYGCSSLTEATIPDSVTSIGDCAFHYCGSLTSVVIPDNVTSIGEYTFYNCYSLTSVVIPDSVTSIGEDAFYDCYRLVEVINKSPYITVEKGASSNGEIGYYALEVFNSTDTYVNKFTNDNGYIIYNNGDEKVLCAYQGTETDLTLPTYVTAINKYAFYYCGLTNVVIGDSVTSIGERAFENCNSLTSVVIPDSVTSIGEYAFYHCDSLTSVVIGDSVTSIDDYAFRSCKSLTSVVIGDNVTSIGYKAFYACSNLTSVVIPDSVTSIGEDAFSSCGKLTSIEVSSNNQNYKSIDGNLYSKDGTTLIQYAIGKTATAFTIPDSVTSIGDYAFYYCYRLTSVVIGDSVTSIGGYAFCSCDSLTKVNYLGTIDEWVSISFGGDCANPTYYAKNLYINNELVTTANITTATKINDYAFSGCASLTSVVIGDSVTSVGHAAFGHCDSLTSVVIPDSVTSIGDYAFAYCDSLTSVVIGNSVTSIGDCAFIGCNSLTSVVIGDSVTRIGEYAFAYCESLTSVYYKGSWSDWSDISIDSYNSELTNATRYYYSESQPTTSGDYWRYVNGVPTRW